MRIDARRLVALGATALLAASLAACGGGETSQALSAQPQAVLASTVLASTAPASTAAVELIDASATLSQTGTTAWTLAKTGALNGSAVTWQIVATETTTVAGQLIVSGQMTVTNTGNGPATIGNIVVNLQKRQGNSWVTKSSDVANATDGDAATTANIHAAASSENKSTFSENGASGALEFMDATNNTLFSLVPQVLIGAGQTRSLLFSASFDNNNAALNLTPGTQIRAEVIVTFGNATASGNSTANVDINGNGTLDADEARVRSVPSRLTLTVPAPVNGNGTVTLSDTLADITKTGDVTFSNVQFNLGATSGTVTATVSGGANGGSITNCAHLTSTGQTTTVGGSTFTLGAPLNLQDCSTINVDGTPTCTPGTAGCGWQPGDLVTFDQVQWGTPGSTAGNLMSTKFGAIYLSSAGVLEVGVAGTGGQSIRFTGGASVLAYLPASGPPQTLTNDVSDPTATSSGVFGGEVTALAVNVDFSAGGLLGGSVTTDFGDLSICGATGLSNMTVSSFLALAENTLGGANTGLTPTQLLSLVQQVNAAFQDGTPSTFAQDHLIIGACP